MQIHVLTLFPQMFQGPMTESIMKRGQEKGIFTLETVNIRDFSTDKHRTADDYPFGGGAGMVMKAEPLFLAYESIPQGPKPPRVILMCPQGEVFNHRKAEELAQEDHLIFVCGHYEGIDERVRESFVTDELSIGDFVLTGGELPAMVVIDAVCRLLPGVVKEEQSVKEDSFADGLLEYPQYTRPAEFRGMAVPEVLLSGNHERIRLWRRKQSLKRTILRRPDLLAKVEWTKEDRKLLQELAEEGIALPPEIKEIQP